jgi:hypothetical protein
VRVNRAGWPVPPEISLDHPYRGVVARGSTAPADASYEDLDAWVRETWLPTRLTADGAARRRSCSRRATSRRARLGGRRRREAAGGVLPHRRPREVWASEFADLGDAVAESGLGTLGLAAPFIPVIPGTETYLDQLW